jgi:hypothetical protein
VVKTTVNEDCTVKNSWQESINGGPLRDATSSGVVAADGAKAFILLAQKDMSIVCEYTRIKGPGM